MQWSASRLWPRFLLGILLVLAFAAGTTAFVPQVDAARGLEPGAGSWRT